MVIWKQYAHWHQTLIPVPTTIRKKEYAEMAKKSTFSIRQR